MLNEKIAEQTNNLADQAANSANEAIKTTQRAANKTLDSLASTVQDLRDHAAPLLNRASEQASAFLHQSVEAVQDGSHKVRAQARKVSAGTVNYIKDEPVKAMLIAAATGAVLMGLLRVLDRSRNGN